MKTFALFFMLYTLTSTAFSLEFKNFKIKMMPPGAKVSLIYGDIYNQDKTSIHLQEIKSSIAELEIHEMIAEHGQMKMRKIPSLEIGANKTVALSPKGLHLMLIGLKRDLNLNEKIDITFKIKNELKTISVPVVAID